MDDPLRYVAPKGTGIKLGVAPNDVKVSMAALHLRWKAFGRLTTSIHVAENARDPPSAGDKLFYRTDCDQSITETPVKCIVIEEKPNPEVKDWLREHLHHAWYSLERCNPLFLRSVTGDYTHDPERRRLMRCCGKDRPLAPTDLHIMADDGKNVTIRDYISVVHPWLQRHRDRILKDLQVDGEDSTSVDMSFYVNPLSLLNYEVTRPKREHLFAALAKHVDELTAPKKEAPSAPPQGQEPVP